MEDGGSHQNRDHDAKEAKVNNVALVDHSSKVATPKICRIVVLAFHHSRVSCVVNNGEIMVEVHKEYVQYHDGEEGGL